MNEETKRWFQERVAQDPEYIGRVFLPTIEKVVSRAEAALRQTNRVSNIEQIKLAQGFFDGVQQCCAILEGLRKSEAPVAPGLMERFFGRSDPQDIPAGLG